MIISRGLSALRGVRALTKHKAITQQFVRNHGDVQWGYRAGPPLPPRINFLIAEVIQGLAWWWVLWHLWTEPEHITGEFEYPDPRKWTDEELGIPEDLELDE